MLHSKYYCSGSSEASGEEDGLVPLAGDPNEGWGFAECTGARMQEPWGELWGGWQHVKACLSESKGSGVPSSPGAEHGWIWGNVHEYSIERYLSLSTFFSLFFLLSSTPFFLATLIFHMLFLVLSSSVSVFLSCCGVSEDIESFTTRGNKHSQIIFKSSMFQRLLESYTKLQKDKTLPQSSHSETFVKVIFFLFLVSILCFLLHIHHCRDAGYPLGKSWHLSSCEITTRMETNYTFFTVVTVIMPFFTVWFCSLFFTAWSDVPTPLSFFSHFYHLSEISTQPMTNKRRSYFI